MSDVMLIGVLRMPMPDDPSDMMLRQFVSRAREAADRIESDALEIARLRAEVKALRADAERYRWLREMSARVMVGNFAAIEVPRNWLADEATASTDDAAIDAARAEKGSADA